MENEFKDNAENANIIKYGSVYLSYIYYIYKPYIYYMYNKILQ